MFTTTVRPTTGLFGTTEFFWAVFGPTATNPNAMLASGIEDTEEEALLASAASQGRY